MRLPPPSILDILEQLGEVAGGVEDAQNQRRLGIGVVDQNIGEAVQDVETDRSIRQIGAYEAQAGELAYLGQSSGNDIAQCPRRGRTLRIQRTAA